MSCSSSNPGGNTSASYRTNAHTKDGFSSLEEHLPSNQPHHHRRISSTATQTCGGKGRRVTVKMTSLGLLRHGCPPSCSCWDSGSLPSTPSPPVLACFCSMITSRAKIAGESDFHHTHLTTSTCSSQESESPHHFQSDLGQTPTRLHVIIVTDVPEYVKRKNPHTLCN